MKAGVLANGEWHPEWGEAKLKTLDFLVCADGGANLAVVAGRVPEAIVGDLDSVSPENLEFCRAHGTKVIQYPREKDETDLELALDYAFSQNLQGVSIDELTLYAASGRRIDHFLGNLALMQQWALKGKRIILEDPWHVLWMTDGAETIHGVPGQQVSIIPVTPQAIVSLEGFYYPLHYDTLRQESPRGISNVLLGEQGKVTVHQGMVYIICLQDSEI